MSRKNLICKRLKEAQEFAEIKFKQLKHKNWDWESFHNGVIEYWSYLENKKVEDRKKYNKKS